MAIKLKNPKNLILIVIALAVFWIIFWFLHISSEHPTAQSDSSYGESELIVEPTVGYEFVQEVVNKSDSLKHLRKELFDEKGLGATENRQVVKTEDDDYLDYVDFPKIKEKTSERPAYKGRRFTKKSSRFKNYVMPVKKSNILLGQHAKTTKLQEKKIIHDYYDDKEDILNESYILIHNAVASLVNKVQKIHSPLPVYTPEHYYKFETDRLPDKSNSRPGLSNGFIGTVPHSPYVYISGIYNGKNSACHRAALPSTASFNISGTEPAINYSRKYVLDISTGVYSEESSGKSHSFIQKVFAHRTLPNLLVTEVDYKKKSLGTNHVTLKIDLKKWSDNQDFTFRTEDAKYSEVSYKIGLLNAPEANQSISKKVHVMYDHIPTELKPPPKHLRCKWVFLTAYGFSKEEAQKYYEEGLKLLVSRDQLYMEHVKGWSHLWRSGRVDVEGNDNLASSLYAAQYSLLSSIPLHFNNFVGASASGLPFGNETNPMVDRITAEQELYVFPALLMMHVGLAKHILMSRNATSGGAYMNAQRGRFNGLAFPYEGASLGVDLHPKKTGLTSPHVTAAVVLAIKQYLDATNDTPFIRESLADIVFDAADYLHSRLSMEGDNFRVMNQVSIDENPGIVHDSVSGNAFISRALEVPSRLDPNQTRFQLWKEDASKIAIPKVNSTLHASYVDYLPRERVGETDVLMLNFPLLMNFSDEMLLQDIVHYEKVLLPQTSPMSKALLGINWLDVGRKEKGDLYLKNLMPHFTSPFKTWNTYHRSGATIPNHLPAVGSMIQMILFGYGGFRVEEGRLYVDPTVPLNCTSVHLVGIDYLDSSLNFVITHHEISVMLTHSGSKELFLLEYEKGSARELELNVQLSVPKGRVAISTDTLLHS